MKKALALVLAVLTVALAFAGCGKSETAKKKILVAEKGSAGESVATTDETLKKEYDFTAVDVQSKALMEVASGTADAAIVDYVMSIGSIGKGTDFENLEVTGDGYSPESYGIAFRKGSDFTAKVNQAIKELKDDGTLKKIGEKYKLADLITADEQFDEFKQSEKDSDWEYIKNKGELVIGITYFAPMNYKENGELVGFETEFAKAVCAKLGIKVKFQEINWDSKETELAGKTIDCIWNGMTIDEDRKANMSISIPYMQNKQVLVVKSK